MRKWFFFIAISILLGFLNEWTKLNVNFFIEWSNSEGCKAEDDEVRAALFEQYFQKKNGLYYYQLIYCPECMKIQENTWIILKWTSPILFTVLFFLLELYFLNKLFPNIQVQRRYVFLYYFTIGMVVFLLFFLFTLSSVAGFQVVARKIWIVLQGPSLFVLLWVYQLIKKNESVQS
jgi:hypothetical protein